MIPSTVLLLLVFPLCLSELTLERGRAGERMACQHKDGEFCTPVDERSADSLYEAAVRLEALGFQDEAFSAMEAASMLEPFRASFTKSLERMSIRYQTKHVAVKVQSVAYGSCKDLKVARENEPVGVAFTRDAPHSIKSIVLGEDVEEDAMHKCTLGWPHDGHKNTMWHTLIIDLSNVPGLDPGQDLITMHYTWVDGDDPFLNALDFAGVYGIKHDIEAVQVLYNLMMRRQAAVRNVSLSADPPPFTIPGHLYDAYTMGGKANVILSYRDQSTAGAREASGQVIYADWSQEAIEELVGKIKKRGQNYYSETDEWLYRSLEEFSGDLKGKHVAIMGSVTPWYESVCIAYDADSCTSIEYNKLDYDHPKIRTLTVDEYTAAAPKQRFDVAFSISSFEHDGLGRYGDPINPDGDLRAMSDMRDVLKRGGMLFLAVPINRDTISWNSHRKYGRHRLPLLLQNWTLVGHCGLTLELLDGDNPNQHVQPVLILENNLPREGAGAGDQHSQAKESDDSPSPTDFTDFDWEAFIRDKSC